MAQNLTFQYDREADILYINTVTPYAGQESDELGDEIIARLNPQTGRIENLEVLFFTSRLLRKDLFSLPITADLRQVETPLPQRDQLEELAFPEGAKVLVTLLPEEYDARFWLSASETSLNEVWENDEDNIYAELLQG